MSTARPQHLISQVIKDLMQKKVKQKKKLEESMLRALQKT